MIGNTAGLGLGLAASNPAKIFMSQNTRLYQSHILRSCGRRQLSSAALSPSPTLKRCTIRSQVLSKDPPPPPSTNTPSSFFTPSLCRFRRNASTTTSPSSTTSPTTASTSAAILDWNSFFRLRTSRRRYSLASSVITSMASTTGMITVLSSNPELQDWINKTLNLDLFVSLGLTTFAALLLGWLIGPVFGNALWRLLHRSRMPEFTVKERGFFERIKKHRVNPSGASTNNPVPDFYGEKVGSVQGYRRWLKDQRAFNRKRGGNYPSTV